jgi:hypothetical protein
MKSEGFIKVDWEVGGIRQAQEFFDALVELLPLPVFLCLEGTSIAPEIRSLLEAKAIPPMMSVPSGTIWPKPGVFHVQADEQFLTQLAELSNRHANPEICDHIHGYQAGQGLFQWFDAFIDPLLVDRLVPEAAIQAFCSRLGVGYSRRQAG